MRARLLEIVWAVAFLAGGSAPVLAAPEATSLVTAGQATLAEDLVGTWRLLSVDVEGPGGRSNDPFYNQIGSGLLIYDQSGWVSVQIASSARPKLDAPSVRLRRPGKGVDSSLKAQLIDSYYAYFGTWTYDPESSIVTHHVTSALYPGEEGAHYAQHVAIEGKRMVFTREVHSGAARAVQKKVWERIAPLPLPAR